MPERPADTTSSIGRTRTGGASVRARIATSAVCVGGTGSTGPGMPPRWIPDAAQPLAARRWTRRRVVLGESCGSEEHGGNSRCSLHPAGPGRKQRIVVAMLDEAPEGAVVDDSVDEGVGQRQAELDITRVEHDVGDPCCPAATPVV